MSPGPKNWSQGSDVLPEQLQHPRVQKAKDKSDRHREAYRIQFYNTVTEIPSDYRREWRDDWEVVDAGFSERQLLGHAHLTVTLVERGSQGGTDAS